MMAAQRSASSAGLAATAAPAFVTASSFARVRFHAVT
jgi:hypothetical protein